MISLNDFASEPQALRDAQLQAVRRVLESGWYVLGPEVTAFEKSWATACGVSEVIGVGNGMDAIEIGLRALAIGPGDEVITTSMTAFASVLAILRAGATPVLADIEPGTALLSIESVQRCITPKTRAVLLVHLYGQARNLDAWSATLPKDVLLLEDCAQSHSASWQGKPAGSFGAFGAFSFYPTKNLGAIGDAGAIATSDVALAKRARMLRNYGQSVRYLHPEIGMNSRLDEIQAALLGVRMQWLEQFTSRRRQIAARYRAAISNPVVRLLNPPVEEANHAYHLFVVTTEKRDAFMAHLAAREVQSLIHYPVPVHRQDSCPGIRIDPRGLPVTEEHATTCVSIPCQPQMSDDDTAQVIEAVNSYGR